MRTPSDLPGTGDYTFWPGDPEVRSLTSAKERLGMNTTSGGKVSEQVDYDPIGSQCQSSPLLVSLLVTSSEVFQMHSRRIRYSSDLTILPQHGK